MMESVPASELLETATPRRCEQRPCQLTMMAGFDLPLTGRCHFLPSPEKPPSKAVLCSAKEQTPSQIRHSSLIPVLGVRAALLE